jgi:hypothetical protein
MSSQQQPPKKLSTPDGEQGKSWTTKLFTDSFQGGLENNSKGCHFGWMCFCGVWKGPLCPYKTED